MTASELIRTLRREANVTQAELAHRTGTHQAAIARLEGTRANPRIATLDAALQALGHRLELTAVPDSPDQDDEQLAAHLRLSPSERAELHDRSYHNARASLGSARLVQ